MFERHPCFPLGIGFGKSIVDVFTSRFGFVVEKSPAMVNLEEIELRSYGEESIVT
jgi:hypothetical protein